MDHRKGHNKDVRWWLFTGDAQCLDLQPFGISFARGAPFPPCQTDKCTQGDNLRLPVLVLYVKGSFSAPADSSMAFPLSPCAGFELEMLLGGGN